MFNKTHSVPPLPPVLGKEASSDGGVIGVTAESSIKSWKSFRKQLGCRCLRALKMFFAVSFFFFFFLVYSRKLIVQMKEWGLCCINVTFNLQY